MRIVWDETKRLANLAKHGLDFEGFADRFDIDTAVEVPTFPSRTGRDRTLFVGPLDGVLVVAAVLSPLGSEAQSLISLRPASAKERRLYEHRS
ncbi:BrnT family toxin [Methylobacterium sp. JK268]